MDKKLSNFIEDESRILNIDIIKSFEKYIKNHGYIKDMKVSEYSSYKENIHSIEDLLYHRFIYQVANDKFTKKEMKLLSLELMTLKENVDKIGRWYA
jgi:hypothetical protein